MLRNVSHTKGLLCIKGRARYSIIRTKNQRGLYDIELGQEPFHYNDGSEAICLYEDITTEQWRSLVRNGELARDIERAPEISQSAEDAFWDMC